MYTINRYVVLIKPKQPFLDWLLAVPDPKPLEITLQELRAQGTAFLISQYETVEEAVGFVEDNYEIFFEEHLLGWCTEESLWPTGRNLALFREWFDVEIRDMVVDVGEEEIELEEI